MSTNLQYHPSRKDFALIPSFAEFERILISRISREESWIYRKDFSHFIIQYKRSDESLTEDIVYLYADDPMVYFFVEMLFQHPRVNIYCKATDLQ